MIITALGCAGLGLVLGWWIGNLGNLITRPTVYGLMIGILALVLVIEVHIFAGWWALNFFLSASGLALFIHMSWRKKLITRFRSSKI